MVALAVMCVWMCVRKKGPLRGAPRWHVPVAIVMCVASAVHSLAAMVYASGANTGAYVFGWCAVATFCAAGFCATRRGRRLLAGGATAWHVGLFFAALVLVVAHARLGRM